MKVNIARELKKYLPFLLQARSDNLNEADTAQRIIKVFEEVLGYNPMTEISYELEIRSKYADIAVKIDGSTKLFVEVKAAAIELKDRHVEQCEMYAAKGNIHWVLLTNGVDWNFYHLTFDEGIEYERVFSVTLTEETLAKDAVTIGLLSRASIKAGEHEEYWKRCAAISPASIGKVIFTEKIILFIRREIRRRAGVLIAVDDLAAGIHSLFTQSVKEQIGPPKIRNKHSIKRSNQADCDIEAAPDLPQKPTEPCV